MVADGANLLAWLAPPPSAFAFGSGGRSPSPSLRDGEVLTAAFLAVAVEIQHRRFFLRLEKTKAPRDFLIGFLDAA